MKTIIAFAILAACLFIGGGCSSSAPPASAQDVKNFQGGPMPADFKKQFEDRQKESQQRANGQAQPH